jgi:DNA mismatch endonuclease (patch repair protein)
MARSNRAFWQAKIDANRKRDADTDRRLTDAGWRIVRVWEHENVERAARRISRLLQKPVKRTK